MLQESRHLQKYAVRSGGEHSYKGLLKKLRSVDCLTDIQTRLVKRRRNRSRRLSGNKEELSHLVKSLDDSRYSTFVQCLRETKQTLCAKVATKGGVVVKAEILCSKVKSRKLVKQQMVKTLSDLRDKTITKPALLEQQLKRLKAENIEILDSLLDGNPIVWFWCQSVSGLSTLQKDSDLVLKLFNFKTIARPSETIKVKAINIDDDRFKKEVVVCPAAELEFFARLSIKGDVRVRGLTQLHSSICVLCRSYSSSPNSIQVFGDQHPFLLRQTISIDDITEPEDIGFSEAENCLYVTDSATNRCIWKISISDHRVTRWLTGASAVPFTLSFSSEGQLLMVRTSHPESSLVIYGPGSDQRYTYPLPMDIHNPQHAVETPSGTFVVLHELKQDKVDVNDRKGRQLWTVREVTRDDQKTIRRFVPKVSDQQLDRPSYLAIDSDEQVFIADTWAERVIHLNPDLNWGRVLSKTREALSNPLWSLRVHYDALNHRLMVAGLAAVDIYAGIKT